MGAKPRMEYTITVNSPNPNIEAILNALASNGILTWKPKVQTKDTTFVKKYKSRSKKNTWYTVSLCTDGVYICSCPGFFWNKGTCCHVENHK